METIKVNMTPNPLDVQTIHASQNDGEARQWEFELHNNGELIDTSDVTEQMFFKAYEGGTEQLLPENTSTPTTSPFKGDIRYPQGLLTDQEFTYRQSPTEEDGLAKITDIKGNTLVWNQLVQNGNFADGIGRWSTGGSNTLSVTDGVCKIQSTNTSGSNHHLVFPDPSIFQNGHTYLLRCEARAYGNMIGGSIFFAQQTNYINIGTLEGLESLTSAWQSGYLLFNRNNLTLTNGKRIVIGNIATVTTDDYFELKNICVFDLTQMGLDITDPSEFTSLFPLSYYSYNQGSLLSFMGNGIKTVGKNLFPYPYSETTKTQNGLTFTDNGDGTITVNGTATAQTYFNLFANTSEARPKIIGGTYVFSNANSLPNGTQVTLTARKSDGTAISSFVLTHSRKEHSLTIGENFEYNSNISVSSGTTLNNYVFALMFEFGSTATSYEPYISTTTSLPISTYFPTGMKRAGNVYDELTENKAITRIGAVDLGTLDWAYNSNGFMYSGGIIDLIAKPSASTVIANIASTIQPTTAYTIYDGGNGIGIHINGQIRVRIDNMSTDPVAFKQSLSGVYLYFELATPTETSFTTASLVTENAEIPLSNEDGTLIGKCTEQLSENPGFIDAKIKLSDSDGKCYSNKIQLHIERSPQ